MYLCNMLVEMVFGERTCRAQPTKLLASSSFRNRLSLSASLSVFESGHKSQQNTLDYRFPVTSHTTNTRVSTWDTFNCQKGWTSPFIINHVKLLLYSIIHDLNLHVSVVKSGLFFYNKAIAVERSDRIGQNVTTIHFLHQQLCL